MTAKLVYLLCTFTSLTCALLLFRSYVRTSTRLLLWSSMSFFGFAVSNIILVVDLIVLPEIDLSGFRLGTMLLGFMLLVHGLIWETSS